MSAPNVLKGGILIITDNVSKSMINAELGINQVCVYPATTVFFSDKEDALFQ